MAEVSGVSAQNNEQKFDNDAAEWDAQLNNASGDKNSGQNSWRVEENKPVDSGNDILDKNGQFKPEVSKVLNNFIGTMTIEMVKSQSPAQKISMGDDE
jgi:hypothetical protein